MTMDVVLSSETLEALLTKEQNTIEYQNAKEDAERCLATKEEYAIIVWTDEEVKDLINDAFQVKLSDEHAIDILNIIEETNDGQTGVTNQSIREDYETHISHHYKED
jgi:hypothetical protein